MSTGEVDADPASITDGRALADSILSDAARELQVIRSEQGTVPGIRVVIVGDDPASTIYARRIIRNTEAIGASGEVIALAADSSARDLRTSLERLSADPAVGGVILQLPLPAGLDVRSVIEGLDPLKDLDGIHPFNVGLVARGSIGFAPSCAEAAVQILKQADVSLRGCDAVVVGRSNVVGRPVQQLLLREDATVTVCHRRTRDLSERTRQADVVIAAAGVPGLLSGQDIRPGAAVIDCGINVLPDGSIVGDVDIESVAPVAGLVTPVPGGVGPVTSAVLMHHLARAVKARLEGGYPDVARMAS